MKGYYELVDIYGDFDMNKYDKKLVIDSLQYLEDYKNIF